SASRRLMSSPVGSMATAAPRSRGRRGVEHTGLGGTSLHLVVSCRPSGGVRGQAVSIWVDVDFDHAAAARAADACRRTAAGLDVAGAGAHTVAGEVIDGWEGRARAGFDPAVRATTSVMVETAAACLALAADIEAASAAATAEQRRREEAR